MSSSVTAAKWYITWTEHCEVEVEVLRLTDGRRSVSMFRCRAHTGTCNLILLPVGRSENCGLFSMGRPLWREDGSAICSVITQWSESHRTRNHTLLSHLRLSQPGEPGTRIYIPQEHGGKLERRLNKYSQFLPRRNHTQRSAMLCRDIIAVYSENHTKR
jgi:hypothetical protein